MRNILVTGGAGFIGSNFVRYLLGKYPDYRIVVFDKLTYAGRVENLLAVDDDPRYAFVRGDIADAASVAAAMQQHQIDTIVNFAAESHVDRSILSADAFVRTDIYGAYVLLEAARQFKVERYHQISTDEVYGDVPEGYSKESDPFLPNSPYAASKASAELLIRSYFTTYNLPVVITRGSNTFGPYQYPEKLLPLFITNAIDDQPLPMYGDGLQVRDWLHVLDHCKGIDVVLHQGRLGEAYNIGGENEQHNIDVIRLMLRALGKPESLIRRVRDREGHDRRYALDTAKLRALGWAPRRDFEAAIGETVDWFRQNDWWWRPIKSGEYLEYYKQQYGERLAAAQPGSEGRYESA
ncbi:MAG: dTDP-glucose 4,6-dehydratase [Chloroflexi bacterium]|nr:dTDP-glucose 4,6-dehydratase [Chloroflexota bacterium]